MITKFRLHLFLLFVLLSHVSCLMSPSPLPAADLFQAERALQQGDIDAAIDGCNQLLAEHPADPTVLALLGRAQLRQANFRDAEKNLKKSAELAPRDPYVLYDLGRLNLARGNTGGAIRDLLQSLLLADTPDTRRTLAQAISEANLFDWARSTFRKARQLNPWDASLIRLEERFLRKIGDFDEALALYPDTTDVSLSAGETVNRWMNRGLLLLAAERPGEAADSFHQAIQQRSTMTRLHCFVGDALAAAGETDDAITVYQSCVDMERPEECEAELNDLEVSPSPCLDIVMANVLVRLGRFRDAGLRLRKIYSGYAGGALAAVLFDDAARLDRPEDPSFIRSFAFYRKTHPDSVTIHYPLDPQLVEALNRNDYSTSLPLLAKLIGTTENEVIRFSLRMILLAVMRTGPRLPPELARDINQIERLDPGSINDPVARNFFMAATAQAEGRFPAFSRFFQQYLDLDPSLSLLVTLLTSAEPLNLASLHLEGTPDISSQPNEFRSRRNKLLAASAQYVQQSLQLQGADAIQARVEALIALDAADVANHWLEEGLAENTLPEADSFLALERLAYDRQDFVQAALYHELAEQAGGDAERILKSLSGFRGGKPDVLQKYFLTLKDSRYRRYNLALSYIRLGDAAHATPLIHDLTDADQALLQGRVALLNADFHQAAIHLRQAVQCAPDNPEPHKYLGILHFATGEPDLARTELETALRTSGPDLDTLRYLAATCEQLDIPRGAERAWQDALQIQGPGHALILSLYAEFLQRQGRDQEAVDLYRRELQFGPDAAAHFQIGRLLYATGTATEALPELQSANQFLPDNGRINYYLALVQNECGHTDQATVTMQKAAELFATGEAEDDSLGSPYPCRAILHAATLVALGRWVDCNDVLQQHLLELEHGRQDLLTDTEVIKGNLDWLTPFRFHWQRNPYSPIDEAALNPGTSQTLIKFLNAQKESNLEQAIRSGRNYLSQDKELLFIRIKVARHLAEVTKPVKENSFVRSIEQLRASGQISAAEDLARKDIAEGRNLTDAWNAIGELRWAANDFKEAARAFSEVLKINPDHGYARIGAGAAARGQGQFDEAATHFLKAATLLPENGITLLRDGSWCLVSAGKHAEALDVLRSRIPELNYPDELVEMVDGLLKESGSDRTREALLQKWSPDSSTARRALLNLLQETGRDPLPLCREFLKQHPDDPHLASILVQNADFRRDRERLINLQRALPALPTMQPLQHAIRALLYLGDQNFTQAASEALMARKLGGHDFLPLHLRTLLAADASGREIHEAVGELPDSLRRDASRMSAFIAEALQRGHERAAQRMVNACQDRDPHDSTWRILQAFVFSATQRQAEAAEILAPLTADDQTPEIFQLQLDMLLQSDQQKSAEILLKRKLDSPLPRDEMRQLFALAIRQTMFPAAFKAWKALYPVSGGFPEDLRQTLNQLPADRLFAFLQSIPAADHDELLQLALAGAEQQAGQTAAASQRLAPLLSRHPDEAACLLIRARLEMAQGHDEQAARTLSTAVSQSETRTGLKAETLGEMGRLKLRLAQFTEAEKYFQESLSLQENHQVWKDLGISRFVRGETNLAIHALNQALSGNEDVDTLRYLAAAEERNGQYNQAELHLRRALACGGGGYELVARRLTDLLQRQGKMNDALAVYHQLAQELRSTDISFNIGLLTLQTGRAIEALEIFRSTLTLAKEPQPRTLYYLGLALHQSGRDEEAAEYFQQSLNWFNAGVDDTVAGRTPYPCRAIVHAMTAAACGQWKRCGEVLSRHLLELRQATNDLLTDTEIVRGDLDFFTPCRFALQRRPTDRRQWTDTLADSVFNARHLALDHFLTAQASADLAEALDAGEAYLALDPELVTVRERLER